MTPSAFIRKWTATTLTERSGSHQHFIDLCELLDEPTPAEVDLHGEWYCFERGASLLSGGDGWADVWKHGHFSWEYKGKHKDLKAAYVKLQQYSVALENPPLLVVCDMERFRIHTNWTNTVQQVYDITLDDLYNSDQRQCLKWVFSDPERLKPGKTRQMLTEEAAEQFAGLAQRLRARGHLPQTVAHFINRLVFCMFAEDIELLPKAMFIHMLEEAVKQPTDFVEMAQSLFRAMKSGGRVDFYPIAWFNGGLYDTDEALPLDPYEIGLVLNAARLDWSAIDPSIFGTLFERGLDPDKRSQLGAHYTDQDKIMRLLEPVIIRPLQAEWETIKAQIAEQMEKAQKAKAASTKTRTWKAAQALHDRFLDRLNRVRVLDPACGSGDFLYLAILVLKDLEHKANLDAEALGLERQISSVGPECVKGIEINPYAAELARITIWIGDIQWMRRHGFDLVRQPILRPLETIECRDALLNQDGSEAIWPEAEFIIGNPPFLGNKRMISVLGEDYTGRLRKAYRGRVPGGADLVMFWFEKARAAIEAGSIRRAGLVGTNSIRGGDNRKVLARIRESGTLFEAWSDEPWVVEGAAVRVSLVCFTSTADETLHLNGHPVMEIFADLTARTSDHSYDLTKAKRLPENANRSFMGITKTGPFNIPGTLARSWLTLPQNPHGRPNSDVLQKSTNGKEITDRSSDRWIMNFGVGRTEAEIALYEAPFAYSTRTVKPFRLKSDQEKNQRLWWQYERWRPSLWKSLSGLKRYIATVLYAKHRIFVWLPVSVLPENLVIIIAREDDTTFGILHSRFHEIWALRLGTSLEDRPRYTPSTTFETFPFPQGLAPNIPASEYANDLRAQRIAAAAKRLNHLRNNWLNPPDLIRYMPEVTEGYPDRILPKDTAAARVLKQRTLTNLYNERPAWLEHAHRDLDITVAQAYGWKPDISEDEILTGLLGLNSERAGT